MTLSFNKCEEKKVLTYGDLKPGDHFICDDEFDDLEKGRYWAIRVKVLTDEGCKRTSRKMYTNISDGSTRAIDDNIEVARIKINISKIEREI